MQSLKKVTIFANRRAYTRSKYSNNIARMGDFCRNLSEIQLQHCESLDSLENLLLAFKATLTILYLKKCNFTKLKLRNIRLFALKRLVLEDCCGLSKQVMMGFLEAAPNLEIINCERFFLLSQIINISVKLRVLILVSSPQLTDAMFCYIVHSCPMLEVVALCKSSLLTDWSVGKLVPAREVLVLY